MNQIIIVATAIIITNGATGIFWYFVARYFKKKHPDAVRAEIEDQVKKLLYKRAKIQEGQQFELNPPNCASCSHCIPIDGTLHCCLGEKAAFTVLIQSTCNKHSMYSKLSK